MWITINRIVAVNSINYKLKVAQIWLFRRPLVLKITYKPSHELLTMLLLFCKDFWKVLSSNFVVAFFYGYIWFSFSLGYKLFWATQYVWEWLLMGRSCWQLKAQNFWPICQLLKWYSVIAFSRLICTVIFLVHFVIWRKHFQYRALFSVFSRDSNICNIRFTFEISPLK